MMSSHDTYNFRVGVGGFATTFQQEMKGLLKNPRLAYLRNLMVRGLNFLTVSPHPQGLGSFFSGRK